MFKSTNEIEKFSFEDCVFSGFEKAEDGLVFELEALIVRANNSQNANFTDSYAGTAFLKFADAKIDAVLKAGYRYYDADGNLLKSVEDEPVPENDREPLYKILKGSYLVACDKTEKGYFLEIEMCEEDGVGASYLLDIACNDAIVTWERYMNRVQH